MKHFFALKSLSFYGGAIAAVIVLFGVTTTYGESHLKAPSAIEGRYQLVPQDLPDCLSVKPLVLLIRQSGRYLTGALLPADANAKQLKTAEEHPFLSGNWDNRQLILQGSAGDHLHCQNPLTIQGNLTKDKLSGTLRLGSAATETRFTAQLQIPLGEDGQR